MLAFKVSKYARSYTFFFLIFTSKKHFDSNGSFKNLCEKLNISNKGVLVKLHLENKGPIVKLHLENKFPIRILHINQNLKVVENLIKSQILLLLD